MYKAVPTTLQMQTADCGAACLKMLFDSYGVQYTLDHIRKESGIGRDGGTIGDIRRAGESLGHPLIAERIDKEKLGQLSPPFIIWWNSNHFVIYEGTRSNQYITNDPAIGRRKFSYDDFMSQFTGVVIRPEDISTFSSYVSQDIVTGKDLFKLFLRSSEFPVLFVLLLSVITVVPTVLSAQLTSFFVDTVLGQQDLSIGLPVLWILFLLSGIISLSTFLSFSIASKTAYITATTKSIEFFRSLVSRPFSWFSSRQSTELATRLAIPSRTISSFIYDIASQAATLLSSIIVIIILLCSCWQIGLMCLIVISFAFGTAYIINNKIDTQNRLVSIESGKQQGLSLLTLGEILNIRCSGLENQRFSTWAGYYTNYVNAELQVSNSLNVVGLSSRAAFYIINIGLIVLGPILIINQDLSLGGYISTSYLMGLVTAGVVVIPSFLQTVQEVISPIDRLKDVYETPGEDLDQQFALKESNLNSKFSESGIVSLNINSVNFNFTPTLSVLENFSYKAKKPGVYGILGPPGSGKTVLLQLLAGLHHPNDGEIVWSSSHDKNTDDSPVSPPTCYIPQQPLLFEGTIADNISLLDHNIPHKDIVAAARLAALTTNESAISLSSLIPPNSSNLSLSIQQRILLARAYSSNRSILLMDHFYTEIPDDDLKIHIDAFRQIYTFSFIVIPSTSSAVKHLDDFISL